MSYEIRNTDVFDGLAAMPEKSVHCCVTSPPYWALRDYGVAGQIGQEATPQDFVATLVRVFAGVHRVLRDDGVLFVNLGDSYNACNGNRGASKSISGNVNEATPAHGRGLTAPGLKPKDRCLIPERFVLAMQEFGWYVRDIIIWHKPAPMPVSVRDRCTPAWEPIYQFTKKPRYFWDAESVKVATLSKPHAPGNKKLDASRNDHSEMQKIWGVGGSNPRNVWATPLDTLSRFELESLVLEMADNDAPDLWRISSEPLKAKHYAAFPSALPTRCIKAATSERGVCAKCGSPWVRVVERSRVATRPGEDSKVLGDVSEKNQARFDAGMQSRRSTLSSVITGNRDPQRHVTQTQTVDWKPSCECDAETIPATVIDPFSGAGTTCLAAHRLGRHGIGLELSAEYCRLSRERIESDADETESEIEPTPTMLFDIAEQVEQATLFEVDA